MRLMVAVVLAACGLAIAPGAVGPAYALPMDCPPNCDRIPNSAWIDPAVLPLYSTYRWPRLAGIAVTVTNPRFQFEEACATPPVPDDPRSFVVAARAVVPQPEGQWQLQVQVMHWRGETWRGGQLAADVFDKAVAALRGCQLTSPLTSPSLTTDTPDRSGRSSQRSAARAGGPARIPGGPPLEQHRRRGGDVGDHPAARRLARGGRPADPRRHELRRCARRTSIRAGEAVRPRPPVE